MRRAANLVVLDFGHRPMRHAFRSLYRYFGVYRLAEKRPAQR